MHFLHEKIQNKGLLEAVKLCGQLKFESCKFKKLHDYFLSVTPLSVIEEKSS